MAERKRLRKGSQASSSSLPPPPRAQAPPQIQGAPRPQLPPQGVNPGVRPQLPPQGVPPGVRPPIQGGPSTQQIRGPSQADLAKNHPDNRWIFRNSDAWTKYNGAFGETRTFVKGLYFVLPSDHKISEWEWEFLNTRLEFWKLHKFLSFGGTANATMTRLFYANMERLPDNEFGFTTYLYRHTITITPATLAAAFDLENEGEEIYPLRNWPETEDESKYKQWITGVGDVHGRKLYCSHLSAVHWLLFVIINNILLPKSQIKTNLESGVIYLLKHWLKMDRKINVPYLIVSHMLQVGKDKIMSLPYSHLLMHLVGRKGTPAPPHVEFENLLKYLSKFRWVSRLNEHGVTFWKPDDSAVNSWIRADGAKINQYRDPENEDNYAYPTSNRKTGGKKGETSTSQEPQASQPNPNDPFMQMQTMFAIWSTGFDERFTTWSTGFDQRYTNDMSEIRGGLTNLNTRVDAISTEVGQMREFQNTLQMNWYNVHGSWNTLQPFV